MSISKRVTAALDAIKSKDAEQALHDICSAIEVTAKNESGRGGRRSYKDFIGDNFPLITRTAFGVTGTIGNLAVAYDHPDVVPNENGVCPIEDIIYHVIRCGLYHESAIPSNLTFGDTNVIRVDSDSSLVLPASLIIGLIVAVVVSPANKNESIHPKYEFTVDFIQISINMLWGKRDELNAIFEAIIGLRESLRAIEMKA